MLGVLGSCFAAVEQHDYSNCTNFDAGGSYPMPYVSLSCHDTFPGSAHHFFVALDLLESASMLKFTCIDTIIITLSVASACQLVVCCMVT